VATTRNKKIVITIEDVDDTRVRVTMTPKASEILDAIKAGQDTAADGYAMACINVIQAVNKEQEGSRGRGIILPATLRGAKQ
jgi:hypothetical protein